MAAGILLVFPAAAPAALFTLTSDPQAHHPDVAVDGAGMAHIVWQRDVEFQGDGVAHGDVVYCQVPRGATACAATRTFELAGIGSKPKIILMPTGQLVIVSERFRDVSGFGGARSKAYALTSTNGGATFGEPRVIAIKAGGVGEGWDGEFEAGPGNFSISLTGVSGSCSVGPTYTAAPLDGTTNDGAFLADRCGHDVSVAFIDPVTPLVADTDFEKIYYRRWGGSGDHNEVSTWLPERSTPFRGKEPHLAGGPRGVFVMYDDGEPPFDYRVRRFDAATNSFGSDSIVSLKDSESAIFGDFFQDDGGTLHSVYLESPGDNQPRELRHAIQPPGDKWRAPKKLASASAAVDGLFSLRVGAAPDGGGAIVGDGNFDGPIYFAPFAPTGGGGACPPTVKLGAAVVRALDGCFAKAKDGDRVAIGPVKVNGVDIEPLGAGASAAAAFGVTVNQKARTLKTSAKAVVRAGNVMLDKSKLGWKLPAGNGAVKRLGSADTTVFNNLAQHAKSLFEFPIKGDAELLIGPGETAKIPANFGLPDLIGGVSGAVDLGTTAGGLNVDQLQINVPEANIGLLKISDIKVTYSGANTFTGSASLSLPPAYGPAFNVGFGFKDGRFNHLHYDQPFSPMLPIVAPPVIGTPPEPLIGLERLGIDYVDAEGSRKFIGSVDIVGGGKYAGLRAAALEGNVTLEFPASGPATISAGGDLSVVTIPFATAKAAYSTDGLFSFGGSFEFPEGVALIDGFVNGWVSVGSPIRFSAHGGASVLGHSGGEAVISSKGITGCANVNPDPTGLSPEVKIGASYEWGDTFPSLSCEVDAFKLAKPTVAGTANTLAVQIPGGLPQAALEIAGAGAAPRVKVTAPDGSGVTSAEDPVLAGRYAALEYPDAQKTYITIGEPPAGSYTIETEAGSAEITDVGLAPGLPDVKVAAKVTGKGAKRTLRYSLRKIDGQNVTFAEQSGGGLYREFASPKKAKGKIVFRPRNARATKRRIIALVEQNGVPRARLELGKYKAPKYRPPAKPRKLRVRRKGRKLIAGWKKVGGARGYKVLVALPKDGRRVLRYLKAKKTKISLGGLEASDRGKIAVEAIGADAQPGKTAKAKLKPQKRKRKEGKRRKGKRR